jgi:hypothetical protein
MNPKRRAAGGGGDQMKLRNKLNDFKDPYTLFKRYWSDILNVMHYFLEYLTSTHYVQTSCLDSVINEETSIPSSKLYLGKT